jgi:hypothetical protein
MRITVWEYQDPILSIDPLRFDTEAELITTLDIQRHPDQEYFVRVEDGNRDKEFHFDGSDGLHFVGVLLYRGMADIVFSLDIPCVESGGLTKYCKMFITPEQEIRI